MFGHQEQESLPVLSRGGWEVKSVFFLNKKIKQSKKYLKNNKVDVVTCDIKKIFIFLKYFMNSVICPFFLITVLILFFKKKKTSEINLMMPAMILCGAALFGATFPF